MVFADSSVIISSRATARYVVASRGDRLERTKLYAVCSLFFYLFAHFKTIWSLLQLKVKSGLDVLGGGKNKELCGSGELAKMWSDDFSINTHSVKW